MTDAVFGGIPPASVLGKERRMFAGAITPDGLKNYLDDLIPSENVYMLDGFHGSGADRILERLKNEAVGRGFNVEAYYCAFNPEKLEHLNIPSLDAAFTTVNKYHSTDACTSGTVDSEKMLDESAIAAKADMLEFNGNEFDMLLSRAIRTIKDAKALHDEMETYYIPCMDFEAVQKCWEATMDRIFEYDVDG